MWTSEPERFIIDPNHFTMGLNSCSPSLKSVKLELRDNSKPREGEGGYHKNAKLTARGREEMILKAFAKENEACKRLMKIPGIGYLTATILLSVAGVASNFKNGREFAAFLGLVPRQNSTGGKTKLLGISKRSDTYVRTLLVHGARAVLSSLLAGRTPQLRQNIWLAELAARRGTKRACVGLANKTVRIAWSLLAHGTEYKLAA